MKTIQRMMVLMLLIASFATSVTLQTAGVYAPNRHINVQIHHQVTDNQNWIGIYHKESSNAWSNVITWQWTKGKSSVDMGGLPKGSYEARLFYNNSFNLEASSAFNVRDNRSSIDTIETKYAPNDTVAITINGELSGDKDWAGIYPVGASNDWGNVIAWNWVGNGTTQLTQNKKPMPSGKYEVRLFFHNSFKLETSSNFEVGDNKPSMHTTESEYKPNDRVAITINGELSGDKDWAGIYPVGASNDWGNVIAWNWVGNGTTQLTQNKKPMPSGKYEVRLFFHNSYHMESSVAFLVSSKNGHGNGDISVSIGNSIEVNSQDYGVLMHASKNAIIHSSLDIENKQFIVNKNGFDIKFTLKNNTSHTKDILFKIEIPGIHLSGNSDTIDILNTLNYMIPVQRHIAKGKTSSINLTADTIEKPLTYPRGYSPVIEINDNHFAVGASMLTSFNKEHISLVQRVKHNDDGTWSMLFENSTETAKYDDPAGMKRFEAKRLVAHAEEKFHMAVRFADLRGGKKSDWITTLAPYKAFFDERFSNRSLPKKDTRPILGMTFSYTNKDQNSMYGHDSEYSQRGYGLAYYKNENAASQYASKLKSKMDKNHFNRVIFWALSGQYYGYPYWDRNDSKVQGVPNPDPLDLATTFNLPSQIFGNLQPNIQTIVNDIRDKFKNSDIDYGFWWGRSGQIPVSSKDGGHILTNSEWNPKYIVDSNILKKQSHLNFAKEQLRSAMGYGAKEIGLDAFTHMNIDAQLPWIKAMKQFTQNKIKFMQEGVMCDYLHTEMSLFLQPRNRWYNKLTQKEFTSPPVLANYLNPGAEVIVWTKHRYMSSEYINKLRGWGFTPLLEIKGGEIDNIPVYHQ